MTDRQDPQPKTEIKRSIFQPLGMPPWPGQSLRESVLAEGIKLTVGDRNQAYGDPKINLTCAAELWEIYKKYAGDKHSPGHDATMQLALHKLARIACGSHRRDNYTDGAVYIAIAFEIEEREHNDNGPVGEPVRTPRRAHRAVEQGPKHEGGSGDSR